MVVFGAGHSSGHESLNKEFGIPTICTPGMQRVQDACKEVCKYLCIKYLIDRLRYDRLAMHHYAYMVKVVQDVEPTFFDDLFRDVKWEQSTDEEMDALEVNDTWIWCLCYGARMQLAIQLGVQIES